MIKHDCEVNVSCNFGNVLFCDTFSCITYGSLRKCSLSNITQDYSQFTTDLLLCSLYNLHSNCTHNYEQRFENSPITISATLTCPPHLRHFTPLHSSGRTAVRSRSLPLPTTSRFMLASFHTS